MNEKHLNVETNIQVIAPSWPPWPILQKVVNSANITGFVSSPEGNPAESPAVSME